MIILGIDPGYAIIGYGVLEYSNNHFKVLGYGAITTKAGTPFNERLEIIYRELDLIMTKYKPDVMAIEKLFYNTNAKCVYRADSHDIRTLCLSKNPFIRRNESSYFLFPLYPEELPSSDY